ncbi:hypothetical protein BPA30113_05561 [Burkholderia paludis]|uniref:Uncharacterized protein n=1 Tax=Burkholderia paludis TaxID=1506587 RepID=A0A6J5F495_9BURK|nr:hypothetical protein LMG30113_07241 [Burkholderia paludis]VWC17746.1 hypothetical protein BPA30113_05561 [Burkholderia paludis]
MTLRTQRPFASRLFLIAKKNSFMGLSDALPAHRGGAGGVTFIATTYKNTDRQ